MEALSTQWQYGLSEPFHMLGIIMGWVPIRYFLLAWVLVLQSPFLSQLIVPVSAYAKAFLCLFLFRYARLIINIVAVARYKATRGAKSPAHSAKDVTVIIPSVEPFGKAFEETVLSAIGSSCAEIIVVTVGEENILKANSFLTALHFPISILSVPQANKRAQLVRGLHKVKTPIVVLADDHVFWPANFLSALLAPFSNPSVGGVACHKRVQRSSTTRLFSQTDLLNYLACLYLERHNFDLAASSHLDNGAVFVISGRTAAYRSEILRSPAFCSAFVSETFLGHDPLNADDDNFITRWLLTHDYRTAFQGAGYWGNDYPAACMETTLGVEGGLRKFHAQCLRWVRSTWRSNSTALFKDRVIWRTQPWSVYTFYLSSFFNFALLVDGALLYICRPAVRGLILGGSAHCKPAALLTRAIAESSVCCVADSATAWEENFALGFLVLWILASKAVKTLPHYRRHPRDWVYFPLGVLFGWYHSLLKAWALWTVTEVGWGSRPGLVR